jgi:hypothetical protein
VAGTILDKFPLDGPALGGISAAGGAVFVAQGTGPLPEPAPQSDGTGTIVAFGDTSGAGAGGGSGSSGGEGGGGATKAHLRLKVTPRRVRAGRLVRLHLRTTRGSQPAGGVTVRVGRKRLRTGSDGRATARVRFHQPGRHVVRAGRLGSTGARVTIRVLPARGG